jgi:hypothetical protein
MGALVRIRRQPSLWLTADTEELLERAIVEYGRPIYVQPDGAWREYFKQKYFWDLYRKGVGNPASNPDDGPRFHMRGAAVDAIDTSDACQAAFRRAGMVRDLGEKWHWNNRRWASMPVIKTNASLAGGTLSPIPVTPSMEDPMSLPLKLDGQHLFVLSPGAITHLTHDADYVRNVLVPDDQWIPVGKEQLVALLDAHGVPRDIVDGYNGMVWDPKLEAMSRGAYWSWQRAEHEDAKRARAAQDAKLDAVLGKLSAA